MSFLRTTIPMWLVHAALAALLLAAALHLTSTPVQAQMEACSDMLEQQAPRAGRELSSELEILSWNIQKSSNKGWDEDLANFIDGVDLAFIQEASVQADISNITPHLHEAFAAGYTTSSQQTGVLTLSTGSPSVHCTLTSLEPWLRTPKATSVTEHPLENREEHLLAINLHAVNFDLSLDSLQSQLQSLQDVLIRHVGPVIFAGDMNTWSESRQSLVDNFMHEHGLNSVAFEPDLRTRVFGRALDHIYIRGLQAQYAQVFPVESSDHNPLRVRLAIP